MTRYLKLYYNFLLSLTFFKEHQLRAAFVDVLKEKFASYDLTFTIGGQISFDVFPCGWDKTYALKHVEDEGFEEIHFFGDKTHKVRALVHSLLLSHLYILQGGNDHEIFEDPRTIGHAVSNPDDTTRILKEMFF
jgi:phosphomannomutase